MAELKLKILNGDGHTLLTSDAGTWATLVYTAEYQEGDRISIEASEAGIWCEIRLDDSMLPGIVYLDRPVVDFHIPFAEKRLGYSPKTFWGDRHVITARLADEREVYAWRNLALNPYDQHGDTGIYPHTSANIETRGESVFASRNTVDGIFANASHGEYPYQSWGINRRADAELKLEFGVPVELEEIRLTMRADFPHDTYWTAATVVFSDGSTETFQLEKKALPQAFTFPAKTVEWLVVKDLIKADEPSPFPALTQLEAYGQVAKK